MSWVVMPFRCSWPGGSWNTLSRSARQRSDRVEEGLICGANRTESEPRRMRLELRQPQSGPMALTVTPSRGVH